MKYSLLFSFLSVCASLASPSPLASQELGSPLLNGRANPIDRVQVGKQKRQLKQQPILRSRSNFDPSVVVATVTAQKTVNVQATRTVTVTAAPVSATTTRIITKTVTDIRTLTTTRIVTVTAGNAKPTTSSTRPASTRAPASTITATALPQPVPTSSSVTFAGPATWFNVGLGACGNWNTNDELVLAVSQTLFGGYPGTTPENMWWGNPICGKKVKVSYGGKSVVATIVDACVGCETWHVDLSPAAFSVLAPQSVGEMDVTWQWA